MKKAFSIWMIIAVMLPGLTKIGILIDFKINQDFIKEMFCINREKPITMCNGKCYLSNQLKIAEEHEKKQTPINQKQQLEVVYFFSKSAFDLIIHKDFFVSKLNPACVDGFYTSSFIADIFRPPKYV